LKKSGRIVPAWIGVGIRELNDDLRRLTSTTSGIMVTELYDGGPAQRAGIQPGDVITSFNGKPVTDVAALAWLTNTAGIGNKIAIQVVRDRKTFNYNVEVEARPFSR